MKDSDLENINLADIPPPSPGARKIAVNSAVAAFEKQKNEASPKGVMNGERLMTSFMSTLWEWLMIRRKTFGTIAAGLVLFPAALALTWQHYDPELRLFDQSETGISKSIAKREDKEADTKKFTVTELTSRQLVQRNLTSNPASKTQTGQVVNSSNSGILSMTGPVSRMASDSLRANMPASSRGRSQKRVWQHWRHVQYVQR